MGRRVRRLSVCSLDMHISSFRIHWNILRDYSRIMADNQMSIVDENCKHQHLSSNSNVDSLEERTPVRACVCVCSEANAKIQHTAFARVGHRQVLVLPFAGLPVEFAHRSVGLIVRATDRLIRCNSARMFAAMIVTIASRNTMLVEETFRPLGTCYRRTC